MLRISQSVGAAPLRFVGEIPSWRQRWKWGDRGSSGLAALAAGTRGAQLRGVDKHRPLLVPSGSSKSGGVVAYVAAQVRYGYVAQPVGRGEVGQPPKPGDPPDDS